MKTLVGAKIIGSLGVLKHSLAILVIYLDTIDLWVVSNDKDHSGIPTILFTCKFYWLVETFVGFHGDYWILPVVALLLFIGLIINVVNIVLSYRLFKILDTVSVFRCPWTFSNIRIFPSEPNPRLN